MTSYLVIQTAFIGDAILASSVLETLHKYHPNAAIDILVRRGNESLYAHHPFIRNVLSWNKQAGKYKQLGRLVRKIRSNHYSAVITLQRFASTGLLTALSGAPNRLGYQSNPFRLFFTHTAPHEIGNGKHEVERNFELIQPLLPPDACLSPPKLYPSPADYEVVARPKPYICLAPNSVWFTKQWPAENWVKLSVMLHDMYPTIDILLIGGPNDRLACEAIRDTTNLPNVINTCGEYNLLQSAALMSHAQLNFVNDSAPLHLASAMNAPVRAIYCSTVPEFGFGPLSDDAAIIQHPTALDCRPCGLHGKKACPKGHFKCSIMDWNEIKALS